ncbi:MAG: hypothetical protein LKE40_13105 [Spirochaetia bacterium]|nr:hypothetical protein [Spirochaetia bacterium]
MLSLETDAMVFIDNVPQAAINPFHEFVNVQPWNGKHIELAICAWDGYPFPGYHPIDNGGARLLTTVSMRKKAYPLWFTHAQMLKKNMDSYQLYYDVLTLQRVCETFPKESFLYQRTISLLHDALSKMELYDDNPVHREERAREVRKRIAPLLQAKNGTYAPIILSTGSAHLDHEWLWVEAETVRKAARTMCNMTSFCAMDSQFTFLFSQPLQTLEVKKKYPSVYRKVLKAYESGQWEPNGVGLVEPDCVLSSGEGLIRNLLKGRRITEKLFPGYWGDTFFVPDSFGFNGNLPQLLVKCGVSYFVTSKLGWNDTNRFPYDTFVWEGIDGSRIKAHMIQGSYEGTNNPVEIASSWNHVQHKDVQSVLFRTIGEGDGGGGTTLDDLEIMKRLTDLEGFPKVKWASLSQSMHQVFATSKNLPIYKGELYFELHRGTYTTQAVIKSNYRKLEALLHDCEYLLCNAYARKSISQTMAENFTNEIDKVWQTVLVSQFHDILPGSSISTVYKEMKIAFQAAIAQLEKMFSALVQPGKYMLNLTPYPSEGIAPYATGIDQHATTVPAILTDNCIRLPWGTIAIAFDGTLSSVLFHGKEMVRKNGKGWNTLLFGEDYAIGWDAWDIEKDMVDKLDTVACPMDCNMTRQGKIGLDSTIRQEMIVHADKARIDFKTTVDWKEKHRMFQAIFPVAIESCEAIFDIPFGFVCRNTTENTSFERAMFEVPGRQYAMVRDDDLCCVLITDSKFGYHAKQGVIGVTLLRSPTAPDDTADRGIQVFSYSIYITDKGLPAVLSEAAVINNPLRPSKQTFVPLISIKGSNHLVVETVKIAENRQCIAFRIRETTGTYAEGILELDSSLDATSLTETDMLERPCPPTSPVYHPFEIKTFIVKRK